MHTHLTEPPKPRRVNHTLPCHACAAPTAAGHDTVRLLCPACTQAGLSKPGPFFARAVQTELLAA